MATTVIEIGATVNLGLLKSGMDEAGAIVQGATQQMSASFSTLSTQSNAAAQQMSTALTSGAAASTASIEATSAAAKEAGQRIVNSVQESGRAVASQAQQITGANTAQSRSWDLVAEASVRAAKAVWANDMAQRELKDALGAAAVAADGDTAALRRVSEATEMAALASKQLAIEQRNATLAAEQAAAAMNMSSQNTLQTFGQAEGAVRRTREEMHEARAAAELMGEAAGVRLNRELRGVLATSEMLGPLLSKAFGVFAVIGFIEVVAHAAEKMSEWISDTFIFTEADKAMADQLAKTNKEIEKRVESISKLKDQNELIGLKGAQRTYQEGIQLAEEYRKKQLQLNDVINAQFFARRDGGTSTTQYVELANRRAALQAELDELGQKLANKQKEFDVQSSEEKVQNAQKATSETLKIWRDELQQKKDAQDGFHEVSKADEADFWRSKLEMARGNGQLYQQVYHEMRQAEQGADKQSLADYVDGVRQQVAATRSGSNERLTVLRDALEHLKSIHAEGTEAYKSLSNQEAEETRKNEDEKRKAILDTERQKIAATKTGTAEHVAAIEAALAVAKRVYGEESDEYRRLMLEKERATVQFNQRVIEAAAERLESEKQHNAALLDLERVAIENRASLGLIGERQRIEALRRVAAQEYQLELKSLQDKLALYQQGSVEYERVQKQIVGLTDRYNKQVQSLDNASLKNRLQLFTSFFDTLNRSIETSLNGYLQGTQTLGQAVQKIWASIALSVIDSLLQMGLKWAQQHLLMRLISKIFHIEEVASATAAETAKTAAATAANSARAGAAVASNAVLLGSDIATAAGSAAAWTTAFTVMAAGRLTYFAETVGLNMMEILSSAAVGSAAAWASTAAIPIIGPVIAPGVAAATYAGIASLAPLASAEDGLFSQAEQLAFVHRNETVLPSKWSLGFESLFASLGPGGFSAPAAMAAPTPRSSSAPAMAFGGGGGVVQFSYNQKVQSLDGQSTARVLRKNRTAVVREVKRAVRLANITIPKGRG